MVWHTVVTGVRASLYVELAVWPLMVETFGQITPYAVVSNVVAEPLTAVLLPVASLFLALASAAWPAPVLLPVARAVGWLALLLLSALVHWVKLAAGWPGALLSVRVPGTWWAVVYYAGLCLWRRARFRASRGR
ncbi:MAG: ComEC/Rec2 family competence protein [Alicyclobacillaceae bacterium]|nr:ComEC/Rec2 family competence protein [Alicyclobacillaceae bacterium]